MAGRICPLAAAGGSLGGNRRKESCAFTGVSLNFLQSEVDIEVKVDARSIEDVYMERYPPLVRLAALTTGSVALAEEIVQDAFVQLYRRWPTVEQPAAWVRVAVINGCRSWVRRRRLERRLTTDDPPLTVTVSDGLDVRDALAVLSPRQRAAVVLRYFEDLSEAEIAATLRCRPGTVKSLLSRSMTRLQEALSHD